MRSGLALLSGLWGLLSLFITVLVIYWIYLIQARLGALLTEVRELKSLLKQ